MQQPQNKIFLFRSHADSRLKDFLVGSHADGRFKSHHTPRTFFVRKPRRQPIQEPPKTRFFVQKPRRQPLQGLFGRKPRRRPIQEPPKTSFFVQKPHRQPIQGPFVGWKPRRQPIQEPPNPRTCFLFGSHADSRFKDFFCSEATQTADPRAIENKVFLFRSHTDSAPNIPQSSASNSTGTMMITTACTPGMGAARFKDPLLVGSHADSRVKSHQTRGLVFCLEATQTADSRTFLFGSHADGRSKSHRKQGFFVQKPHRQPIRGPLVGWKPRRQIQEPPNPRTCFLFGSHADRRFKDFFCSEATQTADPRATEKQGFFVQKPHRQPIRGPLVGWKPRRQIQEPPNPRTCFLFGSHADSRFKDFFCSEATQTADPRATEKPHRQPIQGPFFVRKPRRQPIQEPPNPRTCFLFGSHADSQFKDFFVRKPRRQPIQEPPKTRFFLFRSHADSRFKDLLLVGSRADSRFKSHQTRGLVFCLGATQTADSRTFFVRKPRRRPIQEPPETRFCSEATQTADSRTFLLVGSHADSRFKSHQTRGLVFCLEATQTADSRTFFVRKPCRQPIQQPPKSHTDSPIQGPFVGWKPRRQIQEPPNPRTCFLFGSHADSRFKDLFCSEATQTADPRATENKFFVQKPHRQPIQGPCVGWKPRRQPIQEPPNPRTCFLFGSHTDSRFKDLFCSEATQTADPRATENKVFCSEATQTADSRTFCWLEATQTADSRATKPEDLFFVWKPQRAHARALAGALENLATARGRRLLRRWQCFFVGLASCSKLN